jgi:carboxyl-terminal processing protease
MSDFYSFPPNQPQPPSPKASTGLAAVLLLLLVFLVGLAIGQSGVLAPTLTSSPPPAAVGPTPAPGSTAGPSASPGAPVGFDLFWDALDTIRQNYVGRDEITDQQITYGAIRGMVEALGDTGHSVFLTPEAVAAENESLGGSIVGIGVLLGERDDRVVVISVISDGPADKAGIRSGDALVLVNGEPVAGLAPEEVAPKIRGEEGSTVNVTLERPSTGERLEFDIVREKLTFPAVTWTMVPGTNIALIRMVQFSTGAAAELESARDLAAAAGATSFVLDLRSNPGGFVDEAVDAASLFLRDKTVYIRELADKQRIPVETNDDIAASDQPMVVLIDEGTASSAEILSAALESAGRAQLVGDTTFGTGTVLLNFDLPDGSAIRLAVERWLTPDGDLIFGQGITPNEPVPMPIDEVPLDPTEVGHLDASQVPTMPDRQLRRAIDILQGN